MEAKNQSEIEIYADQINEKKSKSKFKAKQPISSASQYDASSNRAFQLLHMKPKKLSPKKEEAKDDQDEIN